VTSLSVLFVPILTSGYDYRYVIPAFAPLLAAGALGMWGLTVRLRPLARRARAPLAPPRETSLPDRG
jgi:hypothetical protein